VVKEGWCKFQNEGAYDEGPDDGDFDDNDGDGDGDDDDDEEEWDESKINEVRSMSEEDVMSKLVEVVSQITGTPAPEVDVEAPLTVVMDSMSISQFKGMLERRFYLRLGEGYLFRDDCSLGKLTIAVREGKAGDEEDEEGMGGGKGEGPALAPPGLCCSVS